MNLLKGSYLVLFLLAIIGMFVCSPPVLQPEETSHVITTQLTEQNPVNFSAAFISNVEETDPPGSTPGSWLQYLTPIIVMLAAQAVKWFKKLPGWTILYIAVPLISALLAWLATLVITDLSWLQQFLLGFVSVILFELQKQLRQVWNE